MRKEFITKHNYQTKLFSKIIFLTFLLICLMVFLMLKKFSQKMKIVDIAEVEINKTTYSFLTDKINHEVLNTNSLEDILMIHKNNKDEILYVDFNLDKAYLVLDNVSNLLTSSFKNIEDGNLDFTYLDKELSKKTNSFILNIPLGSTLNSMYFYNLGPKVPVKVNFIGSVLTNLETKVTNYGLNNALVEVFVYMEFHSQIIAPFHTKDLTFKYDAIIASKMIQGSVPSFYNGVIEKQSSIYQKELKSS